MPRRIPTTADIDENWDNALRELGGLDVTSNYERLQELRQEQVIDARRKQIESLVRAAETIRAEWLRIRQAAKDAPEPTGTSEITPKSMPREIIVYECANCSEPNLAFSNKSAKGWQCVDCQHKNKRGKVNVIATR